MALRAPVTASKLRDDLGDTKKALQTARSRLIKYGVGLSAYTHTALNRQTRPGWRAII